MLRSAFVLAITLFTLLFQTPAMSETNAMVYDVIVVGGGSGGSAAAVQAARCGASVAILEETGWIGGQITAAAVSTMDDVGHNRSGLYREFIDRIAETYESTGTPYNLCYWGSDTIASDPVTAEAILLHMMKISGPGSIHIYLQTSLSKALTEGSKVTGVEVLREDGSRMTFKAPVTVEATECGDLLPLTGARYRAGNSVSPNIDLNSEIQDLTWVSVIRRQKNISRDLAVRKPEGYDRDVGRFRKVVSKNGSWWPGSCPCNEATFLAYRAMPDRENPLRLDGGELRTWKGITRSALNWGNDVPDNGPDNSGLTVRYLEDLSYRRLINGEAVNRTLRLLYYMQNELDMADWTVDTSQGYDKRGDRVKDRAIVLDDGNDPILAHFPPIPYVRESRRIVGVETMTAKDILRSPRTGGALKNRTDSVALGEYPIDVHGSRVFGSLESDLGESLKDYPARWRGDEGVFQVPYGALIPEKTDGLLAAEKNISVSRLVNGATRLQPITMLTGQAAGAAAALSVRYGVEPRDLPVILVQDELLRSGSRLSLCLFRDTAQSDPYWRGIEGVSLYGYLDPVSAQMFGPSLPLDERRAAAMLNRAFGRRDAPGGEENPISREELARRIAESVPIWTEPEGLWQGPMDCPVSRGEAAMALWESLVQRAAYAMAAGAGRG